ncbi:MAG: AAA family ATPase [Desulfuromonas sp.]|uniref:sigma-54 interaction domain-containing protein n=1 Tax=Desulfuromonas sp. TaxID=892 RepID=UPI000CC51671|nr:sigma-54 dependent transcriptional regulator [Desulfuromonas sp.]PLX85604.1 MAG: AAA family ATPase [Desulfuromonas sp.]
MSRVMFAWIGGHDFDAARGVGEGLGPIAGAAIAEHFHEIALLNNYGPDRDVDGYVEWLKGKCQSDILVTPVTLSSPIDFGAIYVAAKAHVEKILKASRQKSTPVFHLSPGTPAMSAAWIILAKGPFPGAELIQTSVMRGLEQVEMPFNIFTEFIPDLARGADSRLVQLSEGFPPESPAFEAIVHQCADMKDIVSRARLAARRDVPVLIEGETGTGKELFARAIHNESPRVAGSFVAVNCGAIPRDLFESEFFGHKKGAFTGAHRDHAGYFEQANGGTLFLDEIGEMPLDAQVKILRVLNDGMLRRLGDGQERSIDVRIIGATNRSLLSEIAVGRFREDLFYRLAVIVLGLPPLRERHGDLSLLLDAILGQVNKKLSDGPDYSHKKFSVNARNIMIRHGWPGNAREMFNTIMRICVWCQGKTIKEEDVRQALLPSPQKQNADMLQKPLGEGFKLQELQAFLSSHYIQRALKESGGNKSKAATLLGLKNYQTLNNWIEKYGLDC